MCVCVCVCVNSLNLESTALDDCQFLAYSQSQSTVCLYLRFAFQMSVTDIQPYLFMIAKKKKLYDQSLSSWPDHNYDNAPD